MKHKNNLIKVTDRCVAGWDIAEEYKVTSFASDFDNGMKVRQAKIRALRKYWIKYVRIHVFTDPYSTVRGQMMEFSFVLCHVKL